MMRREVDIAALQAGMGMARLLGGFNSPPLCARFRNGKAQHVCHINVMQLS
jgi:hypothetical protein